MVGTVIENYKIISVLGEGGMGIVYKALDMKLERFVALKILSTQSANNPQFIERFKREARNQAKLTHPNIVPVFGFTDDQGVLGIVMEFVEGETLEKIIYRKKRIDVLDALNITKQILAGVGYAHSKGFIHRDIKPSNIIINKEGIIKIMDFGISKSIFEKGITKTGTKIGTILYMSPEQIRAEEPTRQSDIYSIGVTLYEMLLGKTPFDYGTEYEIMEGHLKKVPGRLSLSLTSIPPEVDKIVTHALEKNMAKRYKTCEEFANEIDPIVVRYEKPKHQHEIKEKETKVKMKRAKLALLTLVILSIFIGLSYIIFSAISEFWPSLKKLNTASRQDSTSAGQMYNKDAPGGWAAQQTGIKHSLNSLSFYDGSIGIAVGETGTIIKTSDGGASWKSILYPDSLQLFDIAYTSGRAFFITGDKGTILKSTDVGETWTKINSPAGEALMSIVFMNERRGVIVGDKGTMLLTDDGGNTWYRGHSNTAQLLFGVQSFGNSSLIACGMKGAVIMSSDNGSSWRTIPAFTDNYLRDASFANEKDGYVVGGSGEAYKTDDGGSSWKKIDLGTLNSLLAIRFINSEIGFISSSKGDIFETMDGGHSWHNKHSGSYTALSSIVQGGDVMYVSGYNGTILKSKK